jgi:hypothetical protein
MKLQQRRCRRTQRLHLMPMTCSVFIATLLQAAVAIGSDATLHRPALQIVARTESAKEPPFYMACYCQPSSEELIAPGWHSNNNGRSWSLLKASPDFTSRLPAGYRRSLFPAVLDSRSGRLVIVYNALDMPGLDPDIAEPKLALTSYYLRYRVSTDAGQTWLFDEPVIQTGHTENNPLEGVWKNKNGVYFGDLGSVPIFTKRSELLVPIQICPLGEDGKLTNPGGGYTFHESAVVIGKWQEKNRIAWGISSRIVGDPARTTRGLLEPTIAELPDGRILMILRGSNARGKSHDFPSYKWQCVSTDGGRTWSVPKPWTYASGVPFYSPSSMSQLFVHSTGRIFWFGNITPQNPNGNLPRYPLVVAEVDPATLGIIKSSILEIDTRKPNEAEIELSHFRALEDRRSREIILTVPRNIVGSKSKTCTMYRLKLNAD